METLYRKVAVNERLPNNENLIYSTDKGDLFLKDKRFNLKDGLLITKVSYINYWLEEIPDPTAKLKADKEELIEMLEEIKRRIGIINSEPDGVIRETMIDMLPIGIESIIQKHKQ